jgi:hypothetical protein
MYKSFKFNKPVTTDNSNYEWQIPQDKRYLDRKMLNEEFSQAMGERKVLSQKRQLGGDNDRRTFLHYDDSVVGTNPQEVFMTQLNRRRLLTGEQPMYNSLRVNSSFIPGYSTIRQQGSIRDLKAEKHMLDNDLFASATLGSGRAGRMRFTIYDDGSTNRKRLNNDQKLAVLEFKKKKGLEYHENLVEQNRLKSREIYSNAVVLAQLNEFNDIEDGVVQGSNSNQNTNGNQSTKKTKRERLKEKKEDSKRRYAIKKAEQATMKREQADMAKADQEQDPVRYEVEEARRDLEAYAEKKAKTREAQLEYHKAREEREKKQVYPPSPTKQPNVKPGLKIGTA